MNKTILIHSDKLKFNLLKKRILSDYVNTHLLRINGQIEDTHKDNRNVLITTLPISFDIPDTLNQKDFQLELYYNIINILESKGYKVQLRLDEDKTIIKVQWRTQDEVDINIMKKKLKDVMFF